jgi:hydrogenase maturation protease
MEPSTAGNAARTRLLGLGNDLLADDAFGLLVAREAERLFPRRLEVICSSEAGFNLLDHVVGPARLLVVDAIETGAAPPGTIQVFSAERFPAAPAAGPHFVGLFETLALARRLGMETPEEALILAVEAADCGTVGGPIHPAVRAAIPAVLRMVGEFLEAREAGPGAGRAPGPSPSPDSRADVRPAAPSPLVGA